MEYQKLHSFRDYWRLEKGEMSVSEFADDRLSLKELKSVRDVIAKLQEKGLPSSKIISALQDINKKLMERWQAERVFWTESKRMDTNAVLEAGKELDVRKYRVILSPHACPICVKKTNNGQKRFDKNDIKKGEGHIPPFHPSCYCVFIPE